MARKKVVSKNSKSKVTVKRKTVTKKKSPKRKTVKRTYTKRSNQNLFNRMQSEEDYIDTKIMVKGEQIENNIINKVRKYVHLHIDNYGTSHGRKIEGTLFFLNFLAIVLFIIDTYSLTGTAQNILVTLEIILVGIFIVEYGVRMWVAQNKTRHFFNIYSIIDLIAILPILVHFANLTFFRIFRILRLFRMLRILRFQRIFKQKDTMFGKMTDTQLIVIRIVLTVFTIIFVSSGLIWAVENKINPGQFGTIWDAMYFAVVTLSTVGYGDVSPVTNFGKIISIIIMLLNFGIVTMLGGAVASVLVTAKLKGDMNLDKNKFNKHIIIAGWNHFIQPTLKIIDENKEKKNKIILINETDSDIIKRSTSIYTNLDITHIKDNPTQDSVLKKAFIENCSIFMVIPDYSGLLPNEHPDEDKIILTKQGYEVNR